jgi:hypothetical protein
VSCCTSTQHACTPTCTYTRKQAHDYCSQLQQATVAPLDNTPHLCNCCLLPHMPCRHAVASEACNRGLRVCECLLRLVAAWETSKGTVSRCDSNTATSPSVLFRRSVAYTRCVDTFACVWVCVPLQVLQMAQRTSVHQGRLVAPRPQAQVAGATSSWRMRTLLRQSHSAC